MVLVLLDCRFPPAQVSMQRDPSVCMRRQRHLLSDPRAQLRLQAEPSLSATAAVRLCLLPGGVARAQEQRAVGRKYLLIDDHSTAADGGLSHQGLGNLRGAAGEPIRVCRTDESHQRAGASTTRTWKRADGGAGARALLLSA